MSELDLKIETITADKDLLVSVADIGVPLALKEMGVEGDAALMIAGWIKDAAGGENVGAALLNGGIQLGVKKLVDLLDGDD